MKPPTLADPPSIPPTPPTPRVSSLAVIQPVIRPGRVMLEPANPGPPSVGQLFSVQTDKLLEYPSVNRIPAIFD